MLHKLRLELRRSSPACACLSVMSKDQIPQTRVSACSDLSDVDVCIIMLRTGMAQWKGKAASVMLLQKNQGEMSFVFSGWCVHICFDSTLSAPLLTP